MGQIQFSSIQRLKKCIFLTKTGELHSGNKFFGDGNFLISGQEIHHKFSTSQINQHHKNLRTWVQFLVMGIFWSQVKKFTIKCFFQSEKTPPPRAGPRPAPTFCGPMNGPDFSFHEYLWSLLLRENIFCGYQGDGNFLISGQEIHHKFSKLPAWGSTTLRLVDPPVCLSLLSLSN